MDGLVTRKNKRERDLAVQFSGDVSWAHPGLSWPLPWPSLPQGEPWVMHHFSAATSPSSPAHVLFSSFCWALFFLKAVPPFNYLLDLPVSSLSPWLPRNPKGGGNLCLVFPGAPHRVLGTSWTLGRFSLIGWWVFWWEFFYLLFLFWCLESFGIADGICQCNSVTLGLYYLNKIAAGIYLAITRCQMLCWTFYINDSSHHNLRRLSSPVDRQGNWDLGTF